MRPATLLHGLFHGTEQTEPDVVAVASIVNTGTCPRTTPDSMGVIHPGPATLDDGIDRGRGNPDRIGCHRRRLGIVPARLERIRVRLHRRSYVRLPGGLSPFAVALEPVKAELKEEGIPYSDEVDVGIMIETPAASLIADILAKEADFFSIGTNDLTQYTMSVDRGNADVAYLYSTFQPAVLRSIKHIIECGRNAGIPVGMCGEAAAYPLMIPLLISFGLTEFSVNPVLVLTARCIISKWSKAEADALAAKVMALDTESEIQSLLKESAKE